MKPPAKLSFQVFISDPVPFDEVERAPNGDRRMFQPISSTLIVGEADAVLVDPPMTVDQTERVAKWIEESGKRLKHIFVTHGHGDHWFGTATLVVAALQPRHVVAGHKNKARADDPKAIAETRRYLEDAERLIASSHTAREFYDAMVERYPDRLNPSALWFWGAKTLFK